MSRCYRDSMNLKSSVYNQTGESYVDQISLHRSMCTHLRRVLLAKSVVDSRNPRFTRFQMQKRGAAVTSTPCRPSSCKLRIFERCPSVEMIDKLAYDTEHHPSDIMKVHCRSKSSSNERSCSGDRRVMINDTNCTCSRAGKEFTKTNLKNQRRLCDSKEILQFSNCKPCGMTSRKCKYEVCLESGKQEREPSLRGEVSQAQSEHEESLRKLHSRCAAGEEDEARYAKFVYDITQEIVQNGLYTDQELKEVFVKHLERSSERLNKRRMLYEIYQLKISLNMMDDSDESDELEADLVFAEKFANQRVPKPPTPPKILNENKVIEKLESFRSSQVNVDSNEQRTASSPRSKCVVLVDANPEFLVTERDVLSTLLDNQVNPEQIQRIYRNLYRRSKDMSLCEAVLEEGSKVAYTHRLKVDKSTSATLLNRKERSTGILRKEGTDFITSKSEPSSSYIKDRHHEALEKCARWKIDECRCNSGSCKESEKNKALGKLLPKKMVTNKRINFLEQRSSEKSRRPKKEAESSTERSKLTSDAPPEREAEVKLDSARSEEPEKIEEIEEIEQIEEIEEIEEDIESVIESVIDEQLENKSSASYISDKSDHEEKELSSVPEENHEEVSSTDESMKYLDDFSNRSGSGKVNNRRYSSMREYFELFTVVDDQKIWRISEGSSSSSRSSPGTTASNYLQSPSFSNAIKKRTSSAMSGFKVMDSWNERMSEFTSDFYAVTKCNQHCRTNSATSCSDSCKFARTNCQYLASPGDCFKNTDQDSDSSSKD